jgi:hypothetical protein
MDEIVQIRKNVLSDFVDKALRKMEQVLTRLVNASMDSMSMYDAMDIKNTKEQEASFLEAIGGQRSKVHRDKLAIKMGTNQAILCTLAIRDKDFSIRE